MISKIEKCILAGFILVSFLLSLFIGIQVNNSYIKTQKQDAKPFIALQCQLIENKLKSEYNYTDQFNSFLQADVQANIKASSLYQSVMDKEEVLDIIIKSKNEVKLFGTSAEPGKLDKDYPYRLAVLRKELIIYGPIQIDEYDKSIIITILPIYKDNNLICCVAVVLDAQKIIDELGLDVLAETFHYDYQLWTVSAETGHKLVLETSNENADYLDVVEESFEIPAQWSLLVRPKNGWGIAIVPIVVIGTFFGTILTRLFYLHLVAKREKDELKRLERIDRETQFLNLFGFIEFLQNSHSQKTIFVIETTRAHKIFNMLDIDKRTDWKNDIIATLQKYAKNKTVLARIQESMFAIVFDEYFDEKQIREIHRELEIEIIQSIIIDDERIILQPIIQVFHYNQNDNIEEKLAVVQKEIWRQL